MCVGCLSPDLVRCSGWWGPTVLESPQLWRSWQENRNPTWASMMWVFSSLMKEQGSHVSVKLTCSAWVLGWWDKMSMRLLPAATTLLFLLGILLLMFPLLLCWLVLCSLCQNPPDWQEILTYFRGSELQNYFTKILEDDLRAIVKPQYVDQIPKTVKVIKFNALELAIRYRWP